MDHPLLKIKGLNEPGTDLSDIKTKAVREGKIELVIPDSESIYDAPAFFNPVMVLNRDWTILFSKLYADKYGPVRVFEPLAGIGVRAFRLVKEIPDSVDEVIICDYDDITTAFARMNKERLKVSDKVYQFKREARSLAYDLAENFMKYNIVDLDPFGSPSPFIDSMWSLMQLNGIIAVTATDMTSLCGVYPDACLRKYGGISLNNFHTHETATRILIGMIARSAGRFERGVKPIFSASADHYTKVFFKTRKGRGEGNKSVKQLGYSYTCNSCFNIMYRPLDAIEEISCCGELSKAGPLWIGDLFDKEWCEDGLNVLNKLNPPSFSRMSKMLQEGRDSIGLHGYWTMGDLCRLKGTSQPSFDEFFELIGNHGYRIVRSWFTDQAFRTDAPIELIHNSIEELVK